MGEIIREFPAPTSANTSPGVTPGFIFSKDGSCGVGTYLRIGSVISSSSGHPIIGKNKIVKIRVSVSSEVGSNTTIQIQARTAVATRSDIAGASIVIPAGQYTATATMDVALPDNVELCAYNKSGSTVSNIVMNVFLYPDYT
jgi:hypothetical protein